jgi:hypothetical protein
MEKIKMEFTKEQIELLLDAISYTKCHTKTEEWKNELREVNLLFVKEWQKIKEEEEFRNVKQYIVIIDGKRRKLTPTELKELNQPCMIVKRILNDIVIQ